MSENQLWLKFIISGKPQDYLNYAQKVKQQEFFGGDGIAHYDGRTCDQRNDHKG